MSFQPPGPPDNPHFDAPRSGIPGNDNPYSIPRAKLSGPAELPKVHFWFKAYCVFMALTSGVLLVALGVGCFLLTNTPDLVRDLDLQLEEFQLNLLGIIYSAMGAGLTILYLAGVVFNRGNAGWVFGMVLILLGLTSLCSLPFALPLLIGWIKAENKQAIVNWKS